LGDRPEKGKHTVLGFSIPGPPFRPVSHRAYRIFSAVSPGKTANCRSTIGRLAQQDLQWRSTDRVMLHRFAQLPVHAAVAGCAAVLIIIQRAAAAEATAVAAALPGVDVFPGHTSTVDCYCVPNLIAVPGRLLAFTEARLLTCDDGGTKTVAVRASSDGGVSWAAPAADLVSNSTFTNLGGALYDNATGALFASYTTNGPCYACDWAKWGVNCTEGCRNLWIKKSTNLGISWGAPHNASGAIWHEAARGTPAEIGEFINGGPTKGLQLRDGTLLFVIVDLSSPKPGFPGGGIMSVMSTDHGASWHGGEPMFVRGWSETAIVQLPGGALLANARCGSANAACPNNGAVASRLFAVSTDGGASWGRQWPSSPGGPRVGVRGAVCDGDTLSLDGGALLLFSHPAGLSHITDHHLNGTFVGNCFDYPRQVPGPRCKALAECPLAGDAPCRSNLTILASRKETHAVFCVQF
jgi:hypothetical protein